MESTLVTGVLGVLFGMRHALEPDHLAAVSTLSTQHRSPRAGIWLGALWGIGHSVSLVLVGGALVFFEMQLPDQLATLFEVLVGAMIVGLGARVVVRSIREGRAGKTQHHEHDGSTHVHPVPVIGEHVHLRSWTFATRPLLIGLMHGLAGTGALTALLIPQLPSMGARVGYLALFGAGSVIGMASLTGLVGVPLMHIARAPRAMTWLAGVSGTISMIIGAWWSISSAAKFC